MVCDNRRLDTCINPSCIVYYVNSLPLLKFAKRDLINVVRFDPRLVRCGVASHEIGERREGQNKRHRENDKCHGYFGMQTLDNDKILEGAKDRLQEWAVLDENGPEGLIGDRFSRYDAAKVFRKRFLRYICQ